MRSDQVFFGGDETSHKQTTLEFDYMTQRYAVQYVTKCTKGMLKHIFEMF